MPGFDGTGPLGQGPFTGVGRGYCVMPVDNVKMPFSGFAGLQNYPVNIPYPNPQAGSSFVSYPYPYYPYQPVSTGYAGRSAGYLRGRGGKGIRGRGRRF